jgi:hypothetical protein
MTTDIDDYIRANWDRYTRAAITQQLEAAGHDRAAIDAAYERARVAQRAERGWRMGWREFLFLAVMGTAGAALVWSPADYGAVIIAPIVYLVLVSVAMGLAKALSIAVDRGSTTAVAVVLVLAGAGGAFLALQSSMLLLAVIIAALALLPAIALVAYGRSNVRAAGLVGALLPVLAWLALTGTCYAPLFTGSTV